MSTKIKLNTLYKLFRNGDVVATLRSSFNWMTDWKENVEPKRLELEEIKNICKYGARCRVDEDGNGRIYTAGHTVDLYINNII